MSLKVGDKVKMTKRGFKYYANLDNAFDSHNVGGLLNHKHFTSAVCQQFAIRGIGTVLLFSDNGYPEVRWENSDGIIKFHYTHYFDLRDVRKMTLLEKIIAKLRGAL